jgi:oligopeptide transport system permease protein
MTMAFFMMRAAPGGPFDTEKTLAPEIQANLDKKYHLDEPLIKQYGRYLYDLAHGDFGPSFQYKDYSVNELIATGFPVSLRLGGTAIILAFFIGSLLGTIAALRQNTAIDYTVMATAMTGISIPNFVLAPLMILVFAVNLQWLPAGGWNDGAFKNTILPIIALTLPYVAYISRLMRSSMIEVLRSNPIRTARAKGLPEQIFGIPGLGRYFVQGALNRDYTLVMGVVVFYGVLIILFNIIVDVVYALLDPKVRY